MAEFAYNNAKNDVNISYIPFELNYKYYPKVSFKDKTNPQSRLIKSRKSLTHLINNKSPSCEATLSILG